jgi:FtsZ-binding cell division protein ZapB
MRVLTAYMTMQYMHTMSLEVLEPLEDELQKHNSMWILRIKPYPLEEHPVLLTTEKSLLSYKNEGFLMENQKNVCSVEHIWQHDCSS